MTAKVFSIIPASARVLLFLADRTRAAYIHRSDRVGSASGGEDRYSVLLNPRHPEEMLNWMGELWRY